MKPYFESDTITLFHSDCRDVLPGLPSEFVDVLLTGPPYGMAYEAKGRSGATGPALKPDLHAFVFCHWECWPDFFGAASAHLKIKGALMWWKARGGMGDCAASFAPDYEVMECRWGEAGTPRAFGGMMVGAVEGCPGPRG